MKYTATILITDDNVSNLNILREHLENSGDAFRILRATDGLKAVNIAEKACPDLILMDWEMPVMSGLEALRLLKITPNTQEIPVIMVTARVQPEDLEKALEFGAMDYIKKPIDQLELLARVRSAIRLRQAYRELEHKNKELALAYQNTTDSIKYAQRIQWASLIKSHDIISQNLDAFILYFPYEIVSGDFYWACQVKGHRYKHDHADSNHITLIANIDCTGHGVPGAFMTMLARVLLDTIVNENKVIEPSAILRLLDKKVRDTLTQNDGEDAQDGMEMALVAIDHERQTLQFSGARHHVYYVKENRLHQVKGSSYSVGSYLVEVDKKYTSEEINLSGIQTIYFTTDGFPDQFGGPDNRKYMRKRLRDFFLKLSPHPMNEQKRALEDEFKTWKGEQQQTDDVLIMGLKPSQGGW